MQYKFSPYLLLRMPAKSPEEYVNEHQYFLDDLFFRSAIYLASPVFYDLLSKRAFQAEHLAEKELATLQKYINRYCFRPTPFGLFSSVTLLKWPSPVATTARVTNFRIHVRASMAIQNELYESLTESDLINHTTYYGNPSLYRLSNEYRFFRTNLDETRNQRDYLLQSIAFSKLLKDLIAKCGTGYTRQSLEELIINLAACTNIEARDYADFLIDSQLLVRCEGLSITGDDPLNQLEQLLQDSDRKRYLHAFLSGSQNVPIGIRPSQISELEQNLQQVTGNRSAKKDQLSIILQRYGIARSPDHRIQEQLQTGLDALELLAQAGQPSGLSHFVKHFQRQFEGQSLPLLLAVDPEAGIGYQYEETEKNNALLETLNVPNRGHAKQAGKWSAVHRTIMEAWLRDRSIDPIIRLNEKDLEPLKATAASQPMLGMSVLFRLSENGVFIENAGSINAPALMGRFTATDEETAEAARSMAKHLEALYPDIIFAEILHLTNPHTDNINRRAQIYEYELPLTAKSVLPKSKQIELSDLYIKVVANKLMLYSKKHSKFVIPRLTSAYNHSLNRLPLFRFLCDLPYQYGRSNLGFDLPALFPDMSFYPRVEFKDVILSLATWIIDECQLAGLQVNDPHLCAAAFNKLSIDKRFPRYFSLSEGDQELIFDGQNISDVRFFCHCIRHKKKVIMKEYLSQPIVQQFNAYLLPTEAIVFPPYDPAEPSVSKQRKFIPGSEWLYLKVYLPKAVFNRLLLKLGNLIHKRYGKHRIDQWFFIRYEDHAPHIRLRLKINPDAVGDVLFAFKTSLEDDIHQHVIRELQIDVYNRELERYSAGGIENSETFFWRSSELVYAFLKNQRARPKTGNHLFALYSTLRIIRQFINDSDEVIVFTLESFQQFLPEFGNKSIKVELDKKFRTLSPEISATFQTAGDDLLSNNSKAGRLFLRSLEIIQQETKGSEKQKDYLRSIIHMHLNRTFIDESRKQEMITYYMLYKYMVAQNGRKRMAKSSDQDALPVLTKNSSIISKNCDL